jgi:hypothetical protein
MSCAGHRRRFSAHRDGDLTSAESRRLDLHLGTCVECAAAWRAFNAPLDLLADAPRLSPRGDLAARVFDRLEMERRQPGLSLLFRPFGAARPFMLPSLVPAVFVLTAVLVGAFALDRLGEEPLPAVARGGASDGWASGLPLAGTESNPMFQSSEVSSPRMRSGEVFPRYLLEHPGEGTLFLETVVARDGSVSAVNLLGGDTELARPVLDALRRERYEPGRSRGRPVAVSIYRLITRMDVWGPTT